MKIEKREQLAEALAAIIPSYGRQIKHAGDQQPLFELKKWVELTKDLSIEQINVALERIIKHESDYEPSSSRFRFLALGLYDTDQAYVMASHNDFAHPAIWHAKQAMLGDFNKLSAEACEKQFKKHYNYYCDQVLSGRKLTEAVNLISKPKYDKEPNYEQWKMQTIAKFGENAKNKIEAWEEFSKGWTWEQHRDYFLKEMPKLARNMKI